tara:strand:- start:14087 stop:15250 length:1164 start_codon:yes stop_codon:yes gene_type:complete
MQNNLSEYQIAQLIYKSIANNITTEEKDTLDGWLKNETNRALFIKITDANTIQNKVALYKQIETERIYRKLENKIIKNNKKINNTRFINILKYAAVLILFFGIGYISLNTYMSQNKPLITPDENITLQLEDGSLKIIKEDGATTLFDAKGNIVGTQNGTQIAYNKKEINEETLTYNTLIVPNGKRFQVILSDGTNVHLNAGTSLKYPTRFSKGQNREVFLKGEAFFNVTKDAKHPFTVHSEALNVKVLGTQFNISSYPEDTETDVVLVEGSVNLFTEHDLHNSLLLSPGYKGSYDKKETSLSKSAVVTNIYTSWVDGELVFRNITFDNILKKMERHYNVEIKNRNSELSNEKFNASFRNEPIEKILDYFKITYQIEYTIDENKIIIN